MIRAFAVRASFASLALACGCRDVAPAAPRAIVIAPVPAADASAPIVSEPAPTLEAPFELALAVDRVCARIRGRVHCGDLDAARALSSEPPLAGIDDAVSIALAPRLLCVATKRGTVHCSGGNSFGQLGARLRAERSDDLVKVDRIDDARRVAASQFHVCVVHATGRVSCWGRNDFGETGAGVAYDPNARELVVPKEVPRIEGATGVTASNDATCATTKERGSWCWGRATLDEHAAARGAQNEEPLRLAAIDGVDGIDASDSAFCGVRNGALVCWGDGLVVPRALDRREPQVIVPARVRKVRLGSSHGCALLDDGAVVCFGASYAGALGRAVEGYDAQPPVAVEGLPASVDVVAGGNMSCALADGRDAHCWGSFPPRDGHERRENAPVRVRIVD